MKQRQLMQRNLARLLKQIDYKSCGSDVGEDDQDSPVNPFMKRVFQKKLRRSSVESENVNPNLSLHNTTCQQNNYFKIKNIIAKGHNCLTNLQKAIIQQIDAKPQNKARKNSSHAQQQIIQKLQKSINFITDYLQNEMGSKNSSIYHVQYYQCSNSIQQDPSTTKKQKRPLKQSREHRTRNQVGLAGSMVSQSTNSTKHKSVYESVLQQRKSKRTKNSRIV